MAHGLEGGVQEGCQSLIERFWNNEGSKGILWGGLTVGLRWLPSDLEACLLPVLDGSSAWSTARYYLVHGLLVAGESYSLMCDIFMKCVDLSSKGRQVGLATASQHVEAPKVDSASPLIAQDGGSKLLRIVLVLSLVLLLAFLIEVGQALLPVSFHRGFGFGDLVASFVR